MKKIILSVFVVALSATAMASRGNGSDCAHKTNRGLNANTKGSKIATVQNSAGQSEIVSGTN